ncbi:hypothetical protein Bca101_043792 [Brassica carinata]
MERRRLGPDIAWWRIAIVGAHELNAMAEKLGRRGGVRQWDCATVGFDSNDEGEAQDRLRSFKTPAIRIGASTKEEPRWLEELRL